MFLISVSGRSASFRVLFFTLMVSYVMLVQWRGRNAIYLLGIVIGNAHLRLDGMQMVIRKALGMYDNLLMTVVTSPGYCFSGMWFLLFYAGWKAIPMEYSEAAFIDGAGHFKSMFAIMIPMMIPTFSAIFLLNFLSTWNDYNTFCGLPSYPIWRTAYLFQNDASNYGAAMRWVGGFIICMLPTTVIYAASQKLISSKLTIGGLKG
ncbi:MAG: ABC transporter permease subunit [Christensenellaceae bacterium]